MEALVLTNCTSRKRGKASPSRAASWPHRHHSKVESVEDLAHGWKQEIAKTHTLRAAIDLYTGRSVVEAHEAANLIGAQLAFVSAGLGLTGAHSQVPHYDLTVSTGPSSISPALARLEATSADWWLALNSGPSIAKIVAARRTKLVLIALPSGYLDMIASDLEACHDSCAQKLRFFTSVKGRNAVPEHLRQCVMPYDERLEGTRFAGTRADFPQRALRHFVKELGGHHLTLADSSRRVELALAGIAAPQIPVRKKLEDEEIATLLRLHWTAHNGSSTRLLRFLRDDALVACEQGRFRRIWLELCQEVNS